jgi:acetoin utilization deacetylase AcuC-like enzyme
VRRALDRLPKGRIERRIAPQVSLHDARLAHTPEHVARIASLSDEEAAIDADTYAGPGTREAALRAAGGAAALGEALATGARRGFALARPPGHHAEIARPMGFCLLNNVAIAARAAQRAGARRIAIVDWDAHHGNGTQDVFEADPDVLFVSLHQWPLYPGTGAPGEIGRHAGLGKTMNLAMPPGSSRADYDLAFERAVLPVLEEHAPDLILVSAGYDAHVRDPLAELRLDEPAYVGLTGELAALADRRGIGLGFVLEGGYDLDALEGSVLATLTRAMGDASTPIRDGRGASAATERTIAQTIAAHAPHWQAFAPHR